MAVAPRELHRGRGGSTSIWGNAMSPDPWAIGWDIGGAHLKVALAWLAVVGAVVWLAPNSLQLLHRFGAGVEEQARAAAVPRRGIPVWQPTRLWAFATGATAAVCILHMTKVSEFLYYQF